MGVHAFLFLSISSSCSGVRENDGGPVGGRDIMCYCYGGSRLRLVECGKEGRGERGRQSAKKSGKTESESERRIIYGLNS